MAVFSDSDFERAKSYFLQDDAYGTNNGRGDEPARCVNVVRSGLRKLFDRPDILVPELHDADDLVVNPTPRRPRRGVAPFPATPADVAYMATYTSNRVDQRIRAGGFTEPYTGNTLAGLMNHLHTATPSMCDAGHTFTFADERGVETHGTTEPVEIYSPYGRTARPVLRPIPRDRRGAELTSESAERMFPRLPMRGIIWDYLASQTRGEVGWHWFTMAVLDGFHAVTLAVKCFAARGEPINRRIRVFWADQTGRHGPGVEEYRRADSTNVADVATPNARRLRGLDQYIMFATDNFWHWFDFRPNGQPHVHANYSQPNPSPTDRKSVV